jgi:cell division protein FtsX
MNEPTPIARKTLTERSSEAQVAYDEHQAAIAKAKARYWRNLAAITAVIQVAAVALLIACTIVFLLDLTPWR